MTKDQQRKINTLKKLLDKEYALEKEYDYFERCSFTDSKVKQRKMEAKMTRIQRKLIAISNNFAKKAKELGEELYDLSGIEAEFCIEWKDI
jgi:hypothetical protein